MVTNAQGVVHGIGHKLGGHSNVPHGITSCIMLPPVMDLVRSRRPESHERLRRLSAAIGHDGTGKEEEPTAASAAEGIRQLVNRVGLPSKLSQVGVRREQFPELANTSIKDLVVGSAPIKVDAQYIMQLLETAYCPPNLAAVRLVSD